MGTRRIICRICMGGRGFRFGCGRRDCRILGSCMEGIMGMCCRRGFGRCLLLIVRVFCSFSVFWCNRYTSCNDLHTKPMFPQPDFPVENFAGTKSVVISTVSIIGGKNPFLGVAYMAVGAICWALGLVFLLRHMIKPRFVCCVFVSFTSTFTNHVNAFFGVQEIGRSHLLVVESAAGEG